jgi:hypothetical protein
MNIEEKLSDMKRKFPTLTDVHLSTMKIMRKNILALPHASVRFALEGIASDLLAKTQFSLMTAGIVKMDGTLSAGYDPAIVAPFGKLCGSATTANGCELTIEASQSGNLYKLNWENPRELNADEYTISLTVTKCDIDDPDYPMASILGGHVTFKSSDGALHLVSSMIEASWPHEWDDVVSFADDLKALWDRCKNSFDKSGKTIGGHNFHDINTTSVAELITADDGWVGAETKAAMDTLFASCYQEILEVIPSETTKLAAIIEQMDLVDSTISYGNDDFEIIQNEQNNFFVSKFLEFNTDYTTTVIWNEADVAGRHLTTNIAAFRYDETNAVMDLITSDSLQPTISLNHQDRSIFVAKNARETDCLEQVGATLRWLPKLLAEGKFRVTGPSKQTADHPSVSPS